MRGGPGCQSLHAALFHISTNAMGALMFNGCLAILLAQGGQVVQ